MPEVDTSTPSERRAASTSFGELFGQVTKDLSTLIRQEIDLAKAELKQSATRAGAGAGLLAAAGYSALMAVFFLSCALWWGLADLFGDIEGSIALAALIVAIIWGIIAGILYAIGRKRLKEVQGMPRTADTVKKIPDALKRNEENR
ncbi:phage holin family protein [Naasia sp. SYSU D00948]|uniref:phage holin family protein n=1 Tax=Naasia sp. SYSU D00948 TaxID=2817379 RepID=UPI001B30548E